MRGAIAVALASTGCATTLSTSQPAHVPEKGHFHVEAGVDVSVSTGSIYKVVRAAESFDEASSTRALSEAEKLTVFEGAAHLGFNPPAVLPHVGVAYAPLERWEVGARFASSGWRAAVRRQVLDQNEHGIDASVGLGVGTAIFTPPIDDVLTQVRVDSSARWNIDVPAALGRHGSWYRWWAGPRLVYSDVSQDMTLRPPNDSEISGKVSGHGFYLGGHAGAALGYRSLFVGPEISLVELLGSAEVTGEGATRHVDVDAFIVYPSFNVMGEL